MTIRGLKGHGFLNPSSSTPIAAPMGFFKAIGQFELTKEVESENEVGWPAANENFQQSTLRVIQTSVTWTLGVTFKDLDWDVMQFLMGEYDQVTPTYLEREAFSGIVPSSGPFEYTNTALITAAATAATTVVSRGERGTWGEIDGLTVVTAGVPASATEVQLITGTGKLVFHSSAAGMPFHGSVMVSRSSIKTIGVNASPVPFDQLSFTGVVVTDSSKTANGMRMTVPLMQTDGNVSFTLGDAVPEAQMTMTMIQAPGKRSVIEWARRLAAA